MSGLSDAKLPGALKVLWTYEAGDAIESSAAIVDGTGWEVDRFLTDDSARYVAVIRRI